MTTAPQTGGLAPLSDTEARTIAEHFIIAAIWADSPEGTSPRATRQALRMAEVCAREFVAVIGLPMFRRTLDAYRDAGIHPDAGTACGAFGHDLLLTLDGHGVGFWDRDALAIGPLEFSEGMTEPAESLGEALTEHCHRSPWRDVYGAGRLEFYRGWTYLRRPGGNYE